MISDPFVFFDPKLSKAFTWKRVMIDNWDDRETSLTFGMWGNHIAAAPLREEQYLFNVNGNAIPLATSRNTTNRLFGPLLTGPFNPAPPPASWGASGWFDNGACDARVSSGREWDQGAVAEGACAFYNWDTDRIIF